MFSGELILSLSLLVLWYIWIGYPLCLKALTFALNSRSAKASEDYFPKITVIVAAHNEERIIKQRIDNLYDTAYPVELLSIVVASDGSTDDTLEIVRSLKDNNSVTALDVRPRSGRAGAHNFAFDHLRASKRSGEILVFTDAETTFNRHTLCELVKPFVMPDVGYVAGLLKYSNQNANQVTQSVGIYWRYEHFLRRLESDLGLFAFGTGAVCAVRADLYQNIPPTGDIDFTTPLDVILQGYTCVQSQSAVAWDKMAESRQQEFRARVRMTAKNLYGTVTRWGFGGYIKYPFHSWVIWSHKIGRWLTPFFMLVILAFTLYTLDNTYSLILLLAQLVFYSCGLIYGTTGLGGRISSGIYSFLLANAGFFTGVIKVIIGDVPSSYRPISHNEKVNKGD